MGLKSRKNKSNDGYTGIVNLCYNQSNKGDEQLSNLLMDDNDNKTQSKKANSVKADDAKLRV